MYGRSMESPQLASKQINLILIKFYPLPFLRFLMPTNKASKAILFEETKSSFSSIKSALYFLIGAHVNAYVIKSSFSTKVYTHIKPQS